jgi:hypothetical protein
MPAKLQTCGLPKMDQKLRKAAKQLRNTRAPGRGNHRRTSILDRDGEEVTEPEQVVEVFRQHYETLGQLTSATFDEGHSQHVAQAVAQWASDEGQRVNAKHDGAFTAKEIEEAVKDLPTYKAGDSDELKSELIKAGGTAMETVLLQLFNWLWTGEVMPTAWSQGVIVNLSKLETLSSQAITEG